MKSKINLIGKYNFKSASGNSYFEDQAVGSSDEPHTSNCYVNSPKRNLEDSLNQLHSIRSLTLDKEKLKLDVERTNNFRLAFLREMSHEIPLEISHGNDVYSRKDFFDSEGLFYVKYVSVSGEILN